jgi:hypothetical protein
VWAVGQNLSSSRELRLAQNVVTAEEVDQLPLLQHLDRLDRAAYAGKPSSFRFFGPLLSVIVAVEYDAPVFLYHFSEKLR